jgi:hypothetical protein
MLVGILGRSMSVIANSLNMALHCCLKCEVSGVSFFEIVAGINCAAHSCYFFNVAAVHQSTCQMSPETCVGILETLSSLLSISMSYWAAVLEEWAFIACVQWLHAIANALVSLYALLLQARRPANHSYFRHDGVLQTDCTR